MWVDGPFTSDTSDHISGESWLVDNNDSCGPYTLGSWVEIGIATQIGYTSTWFFWADCRPGGVDNGISNNHFQFVVPSGDYGNWYNYRINHINGTTDQWFVIAQVPGGSTVFSASSTDNPMSPNVIEQGVETTNTASTSTNGNIYFSNSQWRSGATGNFNYQTNGGTILQAQPPYYSWLTVPSSSYPGGYGESYCC